jgi:MraZ protein
VALRFRGEFDHRLDEKGRTAMPSPLREALLSRGKGGSTSMIMLRWLEPCLRLYVTDDWEAKEERFESTGDDLLDLDPNRADLRRVLFSWATEVTLDKHSRLLINPRLREHAGLGSLVVWVGQGNYIELWEPTRWRARIEAALQDREKLRRNILELSR